MLKSISFSSLVSLISLSAGAQNIGLHTTNPQAPVHIANSGQVNTPGGFVVIGEPTEGHLEMDFNILQSKYGAGLLDLQLPPDGGDVGINTSNPLAPLHIHSSGQVNSPNGLLYLGEATEGHLKMDFDLIQAQYGATSTLPLKLQPEGGNVGIHTNFPAAALHIAKEDNAYTPGGLMVVGNPAMAHTEFDLNRISAQWNGDPFTLSLNYSGGDVSMAGGDLFVDYFNNRVGIMDMTPDYTLDVAGSIGVQQFIIRKGDNDTYFNFTNDRLQSFIGGIQMLDFSEGVQDYIKFGNGSNINVNLNDGLYMSGLNKQVGIGNSFYLPTSRLHIQGDVGESAFRINSGTRMTMEVQSDRDIQLGEYVYDEEFPSVTSYFPLKIILSPNYTQQAFSIDGNEITGSYNNLSGGYIKIGENGENLLIDDDEIQSHNTIYNVPSTLKLNYTGGDILLGGFANQTLVGVGTETPDADLHVYHHGDSQYSGNGMRLENDNSKSWRMAVDSEGDYEMYYNYAESPLAVLSHTSGDWSSPSDERFKKDISSLGPILEKIKRLRPVTYHMKTQDASEPLIHGFIAQEVQQVFPEIVTHIGDKYGLQYHQFSVLAIQAVQELAARNEVLQDQVNALEDQNKTLEERLAKIELMLIENAEVMNGTD